MPTETLPKTVQSLGRAPQGIVVRAWVLAACLVCLCVPPPAGAQFVWSIRCGGGEHEFVCPPIPSGNETRALTEMIDAWVSQHPNCEAVPGLRKQMYDSISEPVFASTDPFTVESTDDQVEREYLREATLLHNHLREHDVYILKEGHVMDAGNIAENKQFQYFKRIAVSPLVKTVCETGLHAGHSALIWLFYNPNLHLTSFDIGRYPYTAIAAEYLRKRFPGRFTYVEGDSLETLPRYRDAALLSGPESFLSRDVHHDRPQMCDVTYVDGGHGAGVAKSDLVAFKDISNPHTGLLILDDYWLPVKDSDPEEPKHYLGVQEGLHEAAKAIGGITVVDSVHIHKYGIGRGFVVAKYRSVGPSSGGGFDL